MSTQILMEIEKEILADAQKLAVKRQEEAQDAASKLLASARATGEKEAEVIKQKASENIRTSERKKLSEARRISALKILQARNALIGDVIEETLRRIRDLTHKDEYVRIAGTQLQETVLRIGETHLRVQFGEYDNKRHHEILKAAQIPGEVKLHVEDTPIKGSVGFKVSTEDGRVQIENTVEARLAFLGQNLRKIIAEVLLGKSL